MTAQMPAECARTIDADVDLLVVARITRGPGKDVVLGAVDLVKTCRAPLGQGVVRGRALVELARAGAGDVGEVARVERIVAKVASSDGGAPRVPGIGQHMRAAQYNAARINPGILKLVIVTRRGVAGRGGCPCGRVGSSTASVAGIDQLDSGRVVEKAVNRLVAVVARVVVEIAQKDCGPGLDAVIETAAQSPAGAMEHVGADILGVIPGHGAAP